jgi:hypothetical protein
MVDLILIFKYAIICTLKPQFNEFEGTKDLLLQGFLSAAILVAMDYSFTCLLRFMSVQ